MATTPKIANGVFACCWASTVERDHCDAVAEAVRGLGRAAAIFPSFWDVETALDISQIKTSPMPVLPEKATFVVIDATNHQTAWRNIPPAAAELIRETWANGALPSELKRIAPKRA